MPATTQEVSQAQGLVEAFHLIQDGLRRPAGRPPAKGTKVVKKKKKKGRTASYPSFRVCSCESPPWKITRASYWGSKLVSWDSRRLLLSVMVCLVEAAAR